MTRLADDRDTGLTIRTALRQAAQRFAALPQANPELEAEVLLAHVLDCARSTLHAWPERTLNARRQTDYEQLVTRREAGEPVAYLTGEREFWSLDLRVTPHTLIPRPETELLVERALQHMAADHPGQAADLGTGSGAVALALATERPRWRITATDRSPDALTVARENAERLRCTNVHFAQGDWCQALANTRFDLVVSNPPYVAEADPHLQQGDVRFEPRSALAAGADGLDAIRALVRCSTAHLRPCGWLLFEHGPEQGPACRALLGEAGFETVLSHRDLAGRERITEGRWPDAAAPDTGPSAALDS